MLAEMTDDHEMSVAIISLQVYLGDIQQRMRFLKYTCKQNSSFEIPIIDVANLTQRDLLFLVSILFPDSEKYDIKSVSNTETRNDLLKQLSKYIPHCKLQEPPKPKPVKEQKNCTSCRKTFFIFSTHTCSACGNRFCKPCLQTKIALPRLGLDSLQPVCAACLATSQHKDMEDWMEAGKKLLKDDTVGSTKTAIGSFLMAISACEDTVPPTTQLARFLVDSGYPELAIPVVTGVMLLCNNNPKQLMKVYLILATAFRKMAEYVDTESDATEQLKFLKAAKLASLMACSEESQIVDQTLEMPDQISKRTDEITDTLRAVYATQDRKFAQKINGYLALLDLAWQQRDWENLLKVILNDSLLDGDILVKEDGVIEALEQFVSGKEKHIEQMLPDDRFPIMFLRGVVKLHHHSLSAGSSDIEAAAWSGFHSSWLCQAAVKIVLKLLVKGEGKVLPLKEVTTACNTLLQQIQEKNFKSAQTCPIFFRTLEELTPPSPSKQQWPNLSVTGHNVKIFRKYEQAVSKNIASGDWSEREAALAYLDLFKSCEHPSEAAMCFITAGLWFLKELSVTSSKMDKYTIKKAIMCCMETAHQIAVFSLHPGMQMYISRLLIAVALCTIQLSGDLATEEDGKILIQLLHTFVYSSRFCPFWNAPIVNLSEVYLMNLLSGRLHTEFTLGLTDIDEQQRPVDTSELKYQLYENDLRHFYSLDNPDDAHMEAMNEFLKTKGWSMDDVTNLLYSPLTPYDAEGWLMQQPVLGIPQEFAELRGVVIDMDQDRPSIELQVQKSDHRNVGLFSMSDVHAALDLKKDELMPMFFSLDPPKGSRNQRFHPFQEFRYFSENFTDTDLLHTMFHTDYLLKSFSVGTEVSCKPPFNQRPCTEGLLAKLPYSLQQVLRPVAERGYSHNRVHRFWIQADEIVLDESEQTGSKKVVRIGHVKMAIRSHMLLPDRDGKMRDAPEDDDPDSPEAKFAADLTEHYDEICKYFPMFARLRELCKIQFVGIILNSIVEGLERRARGFDLVIPNDLVRRVQQDARAHHREKVGDCLDDRSRQVETWPSAENDSEVSDAVYTIQRNMPQYASYSQIEPHVKDALRQKDENTLSQVVDALVSVCQSRVSRSTMTYHVRKWLQNRRQVNDLLNLICDSLPVPSEQDLRESMLQHHREALASFKRELHRLTGYGKKSPRQNPCKWVPAALLKKESPDGNSFSLCYGGVCLAPEIQHHPVYYTSGNTTTTPIPQRLYQSRSRPQVTKYRYHQTPSTRGSGGSLLGPQRQLQQATSRPQQPSTNVYAATSSGETPTKPQTPQNQRTATGVKNPQGSGINKARATPAANGNNNPPPSSSGGGSAGGGGDDSGNDGSGGEGDKKGEKQRKRKSGGSKKKQEKGWWKIKNKTLRKVLAGSLIVQYIAKKSKSDHPTDQPTSFAERARRSIETDPENSKYPRPIFKTPSAHQQDILDRHTTKIGKDEVLDMNSNCIVYLIKFKDGQYYVGSTERALWVRIAEHVRAMLRELDQTLGKHAKNLRKAGEKLDFSVEILCGVTSKEALLQVEQVFVDITDAISEGLNVRK